MDKRLVPLLAILMSILHAALAITATIDKSPTFDEPTHLAAGYSYWLRKDFRLDPENGTFPARWAALPLLVSRPKFVPADAPAWQQVSAGQTSQQFFYQLGNNPERMLLAGRVMMSIFSAALCLLIFFCAQQLFGSMAALVSEALAVLDPNLLAHGTLVAADTTVALFFTAAVWITWRLFQHITARTLALTALTVSALFLSKMSAPLFVVMIAVLAAVRISSNDAIEIHIAGCREIIVGRTRKVAVVIGATIAIGAAVIFSIWAAFGFRFSALTENGQPRQIMDWRWNYLLSEQTAAERAISFAREHHLFPEAYLYGLLYTKQTSSSRSAFLDNQWSETGFRSFFPRAFVYKTPLPVVALLGLGTVAAFVRWKRRWRGSFASLSGTIWRDCKKLTPIWALVLVYTAFVLQAKLNIGHRYLLPIYPPIFIACGAAVYLLRAERIRLAAPLIGIFLCWQAAESFVVRPDYLAYFDEIAGGPANGYKHLVDSSLDWGQDLPALKDWLDAYANQNCGDPVYLAYFGTGDPDYYQIHASKLPEKAPNVSPLQPGLYCISATILQHVYEIEQGNWTQTYEETYQKALGWARDFRKIDMNASAENELQRKRSEVFGRLQFARLCAYLRRRQPMANAGYSILIFRVTEADLRQALFGPAPQSLSAN